MRPTRANKPNGYLLGSYRIATAPDPMDTSPYTVAPNAASTTTSTKLNARGNLILGRIRLMTKAAPPSYPAPGNFARPIFAVSPDNAAREKLHTELLLC